MKKSAMGPGFEKKTRVLPFERERYLKQKEAKVVIICSCSAS